MMKVRVEECVVVGDTRIDIIAAKKAGAIPVAVSTGCEDIELLESEKPEYILKNLSDLIMFLERHKGS